MIDAARLTQIRERLAGYQANPKLLAHQFLHHAPSDYADLLAAVEEAQAGWRVASAAADARAKDLHYMANLRELERYGKYHHVGGDEKCLDDCPACERKGLQQRVRFTTTFEELEQRLAACAALPRYEVALNGGPFKSVFQHATGRWVKWADLQSVLQRTQETTK